MNVATWLYLGMVWFCLWVRTAYLTLCARKDWRTDSAHRRDDCPVCQIAEAPKPGGGLW